MTRVALAARRLVRWALRRPAPETPTQWIRKCLDSPELSLEDAGTLAEVLMEMNVRTNTMLDRATALLADAMERELRETQARCPECGQTAIRQAPRRWSPADGSRPEWSHADGDALCGPADGGPAAREPIYGALLAERF